MRSLGWCGVWLLICLGCGGSPTPVDPRLGKMVYIDQETRLAVVDNVSTQTPAIHPGTGRATLVPASYCKTCQKWLPAPPIEVRERNPAAGKCPKSGDVLTLDGPWPETIL